MAKEGQMKIKLPLIGWFWPIGIESLTLAGDMLTVGLDGWTDYTMKVTF